MADDQKTDVSKREEEILAFWNKNKIFEKSLAKEAPKGEFVFYDGPPFATGLPHYGHILAGTIKDAIPRYKTMRGYHVPRRWGWDCHGLPLENQIEKELGIKTKREIEELGVGKFNDAARKAVLRYSDDWKRIIPRFGRWVNMEDDYHQASEGSGRAGTDTSERAQGASSAYRTMDASYTESVWWAFKNLHDKNLIYEGFKPMQLCPRCGTTLSNFEVAQGYKDIVDLAVTVKLRLKDAPNTSLLAWTTTPWTLPGNMAVAVKSDAVYVKVKIGEEFYILVKDRLDFLKDPYTLEKEMRGSELVGKTYKPPFPYFEHFNIEGKEKAWKVYAGNFVTTEDGTGIVHIAPAFGADDLALAQKEGIPIVHHVNKDGFFVDAVTDFKGLQAKPKEDSQSTDVAVIKYLASKGLLFAKEKLTHSYPHCWRCDTPLLNYASSSWFVKVTSFRDKLVAENKKINWVPKEIGDKRFGNWLENARDWAISRARYWGAPIPVWRNPKTKKDIVIGSLDELKHYTKKSGNKYFVMRHGEGEHNLKNIVSCNIDDPVHLTEKGKEGVEKSAQSLSSKKIDFIVASPYIRTQETAEIVRTTLGLPESLLSVDKRLVEYDHGIFNHRPNEEMSKAHPARTMFEKGPPEGESLLSMQKRMAEAVYELEQKYQNKNILIVSHGWPLMILKAMTQGFDRKQTAYFLEVLFEQGVLPPAGWEELDFTPLPHNENYELDFHRPYIDEIKLEENGVHLERVKDVFDCWFESGSMSYAQNHYPFANKKIFDPKSGWFKKSRGYPADFIAEGLDQTRGWFYSLLVLGVGLFGKASYKNVIVNGIVLAEDGQKMSKRLNNYPDPLMVVEKYGADAIRYYLLASPLMRGEDLNFSEKGVGEVASKLIGRLTNVLSFYELYKRSPAPVAERKTRPSGPERSLQQGQDEASVLDQWILARLNQTIAEVTLGMEGYELDRAVRPLVGFVEDFSTWYLRRSRDRFKGEGGDSAGALETTRYVLETFSKLSAPFIPFTAEYVYGRVKKDNAPESVHLCEWPSFAKATAGEARLIAEMAEVRRIVTLALEARQKANIKVRQPLQKLAVGSTQLAGKTDLLKLIADEINVKEVVVGAKEFALDTNITETLKKEGELRDLVREVQDLRKTANLEPKDTAVLIVTSEKRADVTAHWDELARMANLGAQEEGEVFNVRKA